MNKIEYLENLLEKSDMTLIDTNMFNVSGPSSARQYSLTNQLYDSKQGFSFDVDLLAEEIDYLGKMQNLLRHNSTLFVTDGVVAENVALSRILNQSISFHRGLLHKSPRANNKIKVGTGQVGLYDIPYEKDMLGLVEAYAKTLFKIIQVSSEKTIPRSREYEEFARIIDHISRNGHAKRVSEKNFYYKGKTNKTDERIVANAFASAYYSPLDLVSTDSDIFRLCNLFSDYLTEHHKSRKILLPEFPVHLHSLPVLDSSTELEHRVSYRISKRPYVESTVSNISQASLALPASPCSQDQTFLYR